MEENDLIIWDAGVELETVAAGMGCCVGRPNTAAAAE